MGSRSGARDFFRNLLEPVRSRIAFGQTFCFLASHAMQAFETSMQHGNGLMIDPIGGPAYWWPFLLGFAISYLIGSIPFGLILTRLSGAGDLRAIGSGNIGATNVLRTGRKSLALATLLLDALKGALPVWIGGAFFGPDMAIVAGLGTIIGHCFPVWLKFNGGKGVATAAGVILTLTPLAGLLTLVVFLVFVTLTRYVSLSSLLAALSAAPLAYVLGHVQPAEFYLLVAGIIIIKHHENLQRLFAGKEAKLSFSKTPPAEKV